VNEHHLLREKPTTIPYRPFAFVLIAFAFIALAFSLWPSRRSSSSGRKRAAATSSRR